MGTAWHIIIHIRPSFSILFILLWALEVPRSRHIEIKTVASKTNLEKDNIKNKAKLANMALYSSSKTCFWYRRSTIWEIRLVCAKHLNNSMQQRHKTSDASLAYYTLLIGIHHRSTLKKNIILRLNDDSNNSGRSLTQLWLFSPPGNSRTIPLNKIKRTSWWVAPKPSGYSAGESHPSAYNLTIMPVTAKTLVYPI